MRLFALLTLLIASTGTRAEGLPGDPSCAELMAYGAARNPDYREEAKRSFFGKPLADYSPSDIVAMRDRAFKCDPRTPLYSEGSGFARQKLDEVRRLRLRLDDDKQRAEEQKRAAVAKTEEDKQRELERQRLKSGEKKVSTIEDAILLHDAKGAFDIMKAPLLKPDGAVYTTPIELYQQDTSDVISGRFRFPAAAISQLELISRYAGIAHGTNRSPESQKSYQDALSMVQDAKKTYYMVLKTSRQTQYLGIAPDRLRLGQEVRVVGKYVANQQSKLASGETRTSPVMEVMYIGGLPQDAKTR